MRGTAEGKFAVWPSCRACVVTSMTVPRSLSLASPKVAVDGAAAELAVDDAMAVRPTVPQSAIRLITYRVMGEEGTTADRRHHCNPLS